jgi:predicted secreted protein
VQTSDGGYALAGFTNSTGIGIYSFWLVKTDSNGTMQWNKTYGGTGDSEAYAMIKTGDGGYLLAGYTTTSGVAGRQILLVKTDSNGNMIWNQTFGGSGDNVANAVIQTSDGGYAVAGSTDAAGAGGNDFYLIKVNADGSMEWSGTYGGVGDDYAYSLDQSSDGGYLLAGYSYSFSDGYDNFWLVKTDSNGNLMWNQTYDGGSDSEASALIQTSDEGYAVAGSIQSSSGEAEWLVKTDASGNPQWNQTYAASGDNYATSLIQTSDGGYALGGYTDAVGAGGYDFYLIKTTSTGTILIHSSFNLVSLEGFLIIGAIILIIAGAALFIIAKTRKPTFYSH